MQFRKCSSVPSSHAEVLSSSSSSLDEGPVGHPANDDPLSVQIVDTMSADQESEEDPSTMTLLPSTTTKIGLVVFSSLYTFLFSGSIFGWG